MQTSRAHPRGRCFARAIDSTIAIIERCADVDLYFGETERSGALGDEQVLSYRARDPFSHVHSFAKRFLRAFSGFGNPSNGHRLRAIMRDRLRQESK